MEFDYKGMSKEQIENICLNERNVSYPPFQNKYIGSEFYSIGILIRKFALFPSFLPFRICYDHGYSPWNYIIDEGKEDCDTRIVFQKWREKLYEPFYKSVKTIIFPYIFYRKSRHIKQVKNPKGTLIMAGHFYDQEKNLVPSVEEIKNLPQKYWPVCVCVHIADVRNGKYKQYLDAGIPVYTAGHERDVRFVKRLYDVMKNFKYTMSHTLGSSTIYSLEMGIPFALLKNKYIDPGMEDFAKIISDDIEGDIKITQEQIDYINKKACLTMENSISRLECAKIVWGSFFKYICTKEAWRGFGKVLKYLTNRRFYKSVIECIKL